MTSTGLRYISAEEYHASAGLSNSMLKDLEVSPLRFWWKHINPNRPADAPTREMVLGSALHCAVIEPDKFEKLYAPEYNPPEDCLDTVSDLRVWLTDKGYKSKGTLKADIISQVQAIDPHVAILDIEKSRHGKFHEGKTILNIEEWNRVSGMTEALVGEPRLIELLSEGQSEVSMTATDPDTGVLLKSRMDWVAPKFTLDLKTFSQKRGKSIDKSVADAIWYEAYNRQAYFYTKVRKHQAGTQYTPDFVMAFVESEQPHEVRLKILRPTTAGQVNLYWEQARVATQGLIYRFAECSKRFGEKPWRDEAVAEPLIDEDLSQIAW